MVAAIRSARAERAASEAELVEIVLSACEFSEDPSEVADLVDLLVDREQPGRSNRMELALEPGHEHLHIEG